MNRRTAIALLIAPVLKADAASDCWDLIAAMASALAEDNAPGFLKPVDRRMAGYADLDTNVHSLLEQASVRSLISPLANEGGEDARTMQVDWEMNMYPKGLESPLSTDTNGQSNTARMERREQAVTLALRRNGKKWQVTKVEPVAFFVPPDIH